MVATQSSSGTTKLTGTKTVFTFTQRIKHSVLFITLKPSVRDVKTGVQSVAPALKVYQHDPCISSIHTHTPEIQELKVRKPSAASKRDCSSKDTNSSFPTSQKRCAKYT